MVASKETSTNPAPLTLLWGARESVWSLYCVMTLLNGEVCVCVFDVEGAIISRHIYTTW